MWGCMRSVYYLHWMTFNSPSHVEKHTKVLLNGPDSRTFFGNQKVRLKKNMYISV